METVIIEMLIAFDIALVCFVMRDELKMFWRWMTKKRWRW